MAEFAEPYAARVIAILLGIPEGEWRLLAADRLHRAGKRRRGTALLDLQGQIVGTEPVRVARRAALVDPAGSERISA